MSLSYEFSIGSVRAREKYLLSASDYEQMLAMKSEGEIIAFLKDKGYPEGSSVEEMLNSKKEQMWNYIQSVAPDMEIFEPFYLQNDIHNFKTILKGVMFKKKYEDLLLTPSAISTELIRKCIENRNFEQLPEWLREPAAKSYELLAHTKDARLSDGAVDRALMERLILLSKKSLFLSKYFNTLAFYANIKTALRASRTKTTMEFLDTALCDCEDFNRDKTVKMIMAGSERLIKYLESVSAYDCRQAVKLYEDKAVSFEKFVDNRLLRLAKGMCRLANEGPEPLFGYYIGCEYERRAVNIIASGVKTATSSDNIRERLRETYG